MAQVEQKERIRKKAKRQMIKALQAAIYQAGLLFLQKPNFALLISFSGWTCLHEIITHGCQFTAVARVLLQHKAKYVLLFLKKRKNLYAFDN